MKISMKELSLRPYHGRLFWVKTLKDYHSAHKRIFKSEDVFSCAAGGRFAGKEDDDGMWTYLVWAKKPHIMAHEFSHIVLHVFDRCGIDPREAKGEPFCYLLSQIMMDASR